MAKEEECYNLKCKIRTELKNKEGEYDELDTKYKEKISQIELLQAQLDGKESKTDLDKLTLKNTKLEREKDLHGQEIKRQSEMLLSLQAKEKVLRDELKRKDEEFSQIKTDIDLSEECQELKGKITLLKNELAGLKLNKNKLKISIEKLTERREQDIKDLKEIQERFNEKLKEYKAKKRESRGFRKPIYRPKEIIILEKEETRYILLRFWWFILIWFLGGLLLGYAVPRILGV